MASSVDIQKVISRSTSSVQLSDLSRKGLKQVRVLNQTAIIRLISEAVDKVIAEREGQISAAERRKVIQASQRQFEVLARERLKKERSRTEELELVNRSLEKEVETLKARLEAGVEVQASRDQAAERSRELESEVAKLNNLMGEKERELTSLRAQQAGGEKQDAALEELQRDLLDREKLVAKLEGELAAKSGEIERLAAGDSSRVQELLALVTQRLERVGAPSEMNDIKESLVGLQKNLQHLALRGGGTSQFGDDLDDTALVELAQRAGDTQLESNVTEVKVKQAKARGVSDSLAKLKKLQKGV